jgi:hypothetical protein
MSQDTINFYRYPGAKPFEYKERHLFFGRKQDAETLYRLIKINEIVVLISKSGIGKSSLLNAGIIPKILEEVEYEPIRIRFESTIIGREVTLLEIAKAKISPKGGKNTFLNLLIDESLSLWHYLKAFQIKNQKGIILIFDQFEELFTYEQDQIDEFKFQLAEALFTRIPDRYAKVIESALEEEKSLPVTEKELELLQTPLELKVVISIRSDKKYLLSKFSDAIPGIEKINYELQPLDKIQASLAIEEPSQIVDDQLISPPFSFSSDAKSYLLDFLTKNGKQKVEPFQLQILCNVIERKVNKTGQTISLEDLGNIEHIIENYYEDQLNLINNPFYKESVRNFIENGLILEEEERRLNLYEGQIYRDYHLNNNILLQLVNSHLVRREPNLDGGFVYELSHDSLIKPVLLAKVKYQKEKKRQEELTKTEEQAKELVRQKEIAENERRLRKEAQKNLSKARIWSLIATVALFFMLLLTVLSTNYYLKLLVSNGQKFEQDEKFLEAIVTYKNAVNFDPLNVFQLDRKIANANLMNDRKNDYQKLITHADSLFKKGEYAKALKMFKAAEKTQYMNRSRAKDRIFELTRENSTYYNQYIEDAKTFANVPNGLGNQKAIERYKNAMLLNSKDSIQIKTAIEHLNGFKKIN